MLKRIEVDGFRSLIGFSIELSPGLNVLVGANGTGKSNFITFLEFLSVLISEDLNAAIAASQGAGSVFSKEKTGADDGVLRFSVHGHWKLEEIGLADWAKRSHVEAADYTYHCEVRYDRLLPAVYLAQEEISVFPGTIASSTIVRRTELIQGRFDTKIFFDLPEDVRARAFQWSLADQKNTSIEQYLAPRIAPESSIFQAIFYEIDNINATMLDLSGYRSVNIDPAKARKATPVSSGYQISPSGEGLSGALHQLQRGFYSAPSRRSNRYAFITSPTPPDYRSIVSWCKEVNPHISKVHVSVEYGNAELVGHVTFAFGPRLEAFTFSRVSDGTVKWLTLVTMLMAEPILNLIEEPENFLHPFMQETFIALCRDVLERSQHRSLIVSTHSPTLLDCCDVNELIMFDLAAGSTRSTKVQNRDEVALKLSGSRLGLGHIYKIGGLYGEDSGAS